MRQQSGRACGLSCDGAAKYKFIDSCIERRTLVLFCRMRVFVAHVGTPWASDAAKQWCVRSVLVTDNRYIQFQQPSILLVLHRLPDKQTDSYVMTHVDATRCAGNIGLPV